MKMIDVTCAIIRNDEEEILVVQRGQHTDHPFKWEFPGGKIHEGESREECILREIREELSIDIVIVSSLPEVEHDYGFRQIRLIPFVCDTLDELPILSEHSAYRWISVNELDETDFCEADVFVAGLYTRWFAGADSGRILQIEKDPVIPQDENELQSAISSMMSMKEAEWFARSAIDNPAVFSRLLSYSYSEDQKLAFRASWTLTKVCDRFPELIYPHLKEIISKLEKTPSESTERSFLRIISFSDLNLIGSTEQGILADFCFARLRSGFSAVAIKAYAMEILYKLALIYPELGNELAATISMLQVDGSAGILSRSRQILKKLSAL